MLPQIDLLPSGFSELFAQVSTSGKLTLADRYGLLAALTLGESALTPEEYKAIDRLLRALYRGRIEVVDDVSMIH